MLRICLSYLELPRLAQQQHKTVTTTTKKAEATWQLRILPEATLDKKFQKMRVVVVVVCIYLQYLHYTSEKIELSFHRHYEALLHLHSLLALWVFLEFLVTVVVVFIVLSFCRADIIICIPSENKIKSDFRLNENCVVFPLLSPSIFFLLLFILFSSHLPFVVSVVAQCFFFALWYANRPEVIAFCIISPLYSIIWSPSNGVWWRCAMRVPNFEGYLTFK